MEFRCACNLITEKSEAALKDFLMQRKEMALPRDLVQQMGFTQLCASLKHPEVFITTLYYVVSKKSSCDHGKYTGSAS